MERVVSFSPKVNSATKLENGAIVSVNAIVEKRPIPGDKALHEAKHIIPNPRIIYASIVPTAEADAITVPEKITAAAAAGPASDGHVGVGHDLNVLTLRLGVDIKKGLALARAALKGKSEEVLEIATILEERKTIGQRDVDEGLDNVRKRREGIFTVEVSVTRPEGGTLTYITRTVNNSVEIEVEEDSSAQAA